MRGPFWIDHRDTNCIFPPVELALDEPNGLLAAGGDLTPRRIISAYRQGVFPWYSAENPILWWSPNPRAVLIPSKLKVSRSLRKAIRKKPFRITIDHCFEEVLRQCAAPRAYADGTWLTPEMQAAYVQLHKEGVAHSFEAWQGETLVGGLYGLALGRIFFGESMFSRVTDASKIAFVHAAKQLEAWGFALIDCQVASEHLKSFGAIDVPRRNFIECMLQLIDQPDHPSPWRFDEGFDPLKTTAADE
jgi:leucyl/phenylalanyl-tRNA--protein transferase